MGCLFKEGIDFIDLQMPEPEGDFEIMQLNNVYSFSLFYFLQSIYHKFKLYNFNDSRLLDYKLQHLAIMFTAVLPPPKIMPEA